MSDKPEDLLIEEAISAFRERNAWGRIQPSPAWMDLAPANREVLFERQLASRFIEGAMDPDGRSSTVRAVLARLI